jgi:(2Fe-2S) ferredoxin
MEIIITLEKMKGLSVTQKTLLLILFLLQFFTGQLMAQITVETKDATCEGKNDGIAIIHLNTSLAGSFKYSVDGKPYQSSNFFSNLEVGSHTATVYDALSRCEFSKPFFIKEKEKFSVTITSSDDLVQNFQECEEAPRITLVANVNGGTEPFSYSWGKEELEVSSSGVYPLVVKDSVGCEAKDEAYVVYIPIQCAKDPNDIIGPEGVGAGKWVAATDRLNYTIRFENDPVFATVPAQVVRIKQVLDPGLNIFSLRLGSFGFANMTFPVPDNRTYYTQRLDLRDSLGIYVDLIAGIDVPKKEAFWFFSSIDPQTGLAPFDAHLGFLPVNDSLTHKGEGFVSYTIVPAMDVATGDTIYAEADIIFDNNESILTPKIFNKVDAGSPATTLTIEKDTVTSGTPVRIVVNGKDDTNGSGYMNYDIYYKRDSEPLSLFKHKWPVDSAAVFVPENGRYCFYSVGRDSVNNSEEIEGKGGKCFLSVKPGYLALKSPIDQEGLCTGSNLTVQWFAQDVSDINLYYSADGFNYYPMAKNIPAADSSYSWVIPDSLSEVVQFAVKIEDAFDKNISSVIDRYFSVKQSLQAKIVSSSANKICKGSTTLLTSLETKGTITWSTGDQSPEITVEEPGYYKLTIQDSYGCVRSDSLLLEEEVPPAKPFAMASGKTQICEGDSVILYAPAGYAFYKWNNGSTERSFVVKESGEFFVAVSHGDICYSPNSDVVNVEVNTNPEVPLIEKSRDENLCEGDTIWLKAPEGYATYSWSGGRSELEIMLDYTSNVTLKVVDENGCSAVSDTIKVKVNSLPVKPDITISSAGFCEGDTVVLSAPEGFKEVFWSNGSKELIQEVTKNGRYALFVTDHNGCSSIPSDTVTIQLHPLPAKPVVSYNVPSKFCKGDTVILTAPIANMYKWSSGDVTRSVKVGEGGKYWLAVADFSGCFSPVSDTIYLNQPDVYAGEDQIIYKGYDYDRCVTLHATVKGVTSGYSIAWSNGMLSEQLEVCTDTNAKFVVVLDTESGCRATDTVMVCVEDVRCITGDGTAGIEMCEYKDGVFYTRCVDAGDVPELLKKGLMLGNCVSDGQCAKPPITVSVKDNLKFNVKSIAMPNPFSDETDIIFTIAKDCHHAELKVYDLGGHERAVLFKGSIVAGKGYRVKFTPDKNLPSGVYVYKLISNNDVYLIDKVVLIR